MKLRLLIIAIGLSIVSVPPVLGAPDPGPAPASLQETRALVSGVRAAIAEGTFVSRVRGMIAAGRSPMPAVPSLPAPAAEDLEITQDLPVGLRAPVAGLAAAVRTATAAFDRFRSRPIGPTLRRLLSAPLSPLPMPGRSPGDGFGPRLPFPQLSSPAPATGPRDDTANRAALLVASALDTYLPAIRAAAGSTGSGRRVEGCDLLDQTPNLCIGSAAGNTYIDDEALLVDLGGNDTYRNSAGGAYYTDDQGNFGLFVSVNVDLGGDDLYDTPRHFVQPTIDPEKSTHQIIGQGAALGVGVGMLVDMLGDDVYRAVAPTTTPKADTALVVVQGSGNTTLPGLGALFDLGGDDTYEATARDGNDAIGLWAQGTGYGLATPLGGLVDAGRGSDTYTIDAGMAVDPGVGELATWPLHAAVGQGIGSLGSAVLSDDGGPSDFTMRAGARWVTPDGYPFFSSPITTKIPIANVAGQGLASLGGAGLLLTGPGETTYTAETVSEGMGYNSISAQAAAAGGPGVLDDLGGDDTYKVRASLVYDHDVTVAEPCMTTSDETEEEIPCPHASGFVHAYNSGISQTVGGQGAGFLGGVGLLEDHLGNDTYTSIVEGRLTTEMHDELEAPQAPPDFTVWGYGDQWNIAQGVGQGYGVGALTDREGDDVYVARSTTTTDASAVSAHAEGTPRVTVLHVYRDGLFAQGVGYGIAAFGQLADLAGSNDRFEVVSENRATTTPDTGGVLRMSLSWPLAQAGAAAGNATGSFLALGQDPRVSVSPAAGVCPGSGPRGFGAWVDCPLFGDDPDHEPIDHKTVTPAAGAAPFAVGQPTTIAFMPGTPATGVWGHRLLGEEGNTVPVGAVLRGPGGLPLAGRAVHFDLQARLKAENTFYKVWLTTWEADGVTGANGVAEARIPFEDPAPWGLNTETFDFRLLATYDGASGRPGLYPAHAASPFTISG